MQRLIQSVAPMRDMFYKRAVNKFLEQQKGLGVELDDAAAVEALGFARTVAIDASILLEGDEHVRGACAPFALCPVSRLKRQPSWMMLTAGVALDFGADAATLRKSFGALSFEELVGFLELGQALRKLLVDGVECAVDLGALRDIVTCRPDGHRVKLAQDLTRDLIDLSDNLDLIAKELDAERVLRIWRKHIHALPAHTEAAASKINIVAVILDVY